MAKLKISQRFGIIPNNILNHTELTWKAKGLFGYLQSKPDEWEFSAQRIAYDSKDGVDSTNNGLRELEEFGFLKRNKYQNDKGFWEIEYVLSEHPEMEKPNTENPSTENPSTEIPLTNIKKEIIKKEIIKNNNIEQENGNFLPIVKKDFKEIMQENLTITDYQDYGDNDYIKSELKNFYLYWTEKAVNGKKEKWQMEKTFDVSRRFYKWLENNKKWNKGKSDKHSEHENIESIF